MDTLTKSSVQVTFKPEFEAKLKELGIKEQFVNNWNNEAISTHNICNELSMPISSWESFIANGFDWDNTPEGSDFWLQVAIL